MVLDATEHRLKHIDCVTRPPAMDDRVHEQQLGRMLDSNAGAKPRLPPSVCPTRSCQGSGSGLLLPALPLDAYLQDDT